MLNIWYFILLFRWTPFKRKWTSITMELIKSSNNKSENVKKDSFKW